MAVALLAMGLAACRKADETAPDGCSEGVKRVGMTFTLTVQEMQQPSAATAAAANRSDGTCDVSGDSGRALALDIARPATRGTVPGSAEERALKGLWVLQFDGILSSSVLRSCEYYPEEQIVENTVYVSLVEMTGTIRAYFVANVGAECFTSLAVGSTTYGDFEKMTYDFAPTSTVPSGGLPMSGLYQGPTSPANGTVSLVRMVSKIHFTCEVSLSDPSDVFSVRGVQLKSHATRSAYKAPTPPKGTAGLYPGASDPTNFSDGTFETESQPLFSRTWYVCENLRGVVAGLTEATKSGSNVPAQSTCIEVAGDYTPQDEETVGVTYSLYLGGNASTDFNLIRNHFYTVTARICGINEDDGRVSVHREPTANCYMVHDAGTTYEFNARVMGNGVETPPFSATGGGVSAPAIVPEKLTPASVLVLWETGSKGSVIASASLSGGKVRFTTAGAKGQPVTEGNAVIAVFDDAGNILWSWHIWSTSYDPDTDYDTYTTHSMYGNKTYTVMRYNLGADATSDPGTQGRFGLLYQWGRKDPFVGAATAQANESVFADYTPWSDAYAQQPETSTLTGDAQIMYSVQHPTRFLTRDSEPYDWVTDDAGARRDNLWGNPNKYTIPNKETGSKTIYDPCPAGWQVAPQCTWTGFTTTGMTQSANEAYVCPPYDTGWNFYLEKQWSGPTAYYPTAGRRSETGALQYVGGIGYYWSSSPYANNLSGASYFSFISTGILPMAEASRVHGNGIRCIKE